MATPENFLDDGEIFKTYFHGDEYYILKSKTTGRLIGQLSLDFKTLDVYAKIFELTIEEQEFLKLRFL